MTQTGETSFHGQPCWYELGANGIDVAARFYNRIFGWEIADSGMEGYDYHLARVGSEPVAGMMDLARQSGNPPPNWLVYFAVDDCEQTAKGIEAAGGRILIEPSDIPGTGRFAVAADPQGAVFGLMQPDMSQMSEADRARAETGEGAFNQKKSGHGQWHQLMTPDPEAGFSFYSGLFGWARGEAMDMGPAGRYQIFQYKGANIGGMMGLGDFPGPAWLPYFGVEESVAQVAESIRDAGGKVLHGPSEVPGGTHILIAADPQGALFALIGPP